MLRVRDKADGRDGLRPGGVQWNPAPLKRTVRVVEKLCLDPAQRSALESADPAQLDASGVLDTVRGMFECSTMGHAVAVLRTLGSEAKVCLHACTDMYVHTHERRTLAN